MKVWKNILISLLNDYKRILKNGMKTSDTTTKKLNQKEKVNSVKPIIEEKNKKMLLKKGSKGDDVKELQKLLNITVDGDFGPATELAVMRFQGTKRFKN